MKKGQYGLVPISGFLGVLVSLGQLIIGDASRYTHAFVMVAEDLAVEARPGGAGLVIPSQRWPNAVYSHIPMTEQQADDVARGAYTLIGRGYNWLDYVYMALWRIGIKSKWIQKKVADKGDLICSQLVDEAERLGDIHLFNDGRLSQDVSPGDLTYVGNVY